ncbi:MAG: lysophospholipid acyltransferase family protein [Acidimicrobiales bacterium]
MNEPSATTPFREPKSGEAKSLEWAVRVGHQRSSLVFYRVVRFFIRSVIFRWLRTEVRGAENLRLDGPVIVAPVHRSNLDAPLVAGVATRRLRALGKESLFVNPIGAWVCAALGAIPLRRGEADRDAMRSARTILDDGEMMIVFPEGTRQRGDRVAGVFDGMSYLASKTGATIVPVGIAGTEAALPSGARFLHRSHTAIVVGEPIAAPVGRMSRPALTAFSEDVGARLQAAFDEANDLIRR